MRALPEWLWRKAPDEAALKKMKDESELMGVLGHEITHVTHHHHYRRQLAKSTTLGLALQGGLRPLHVIGAGADAGQPVARDAGLIVVGVRPRARLPWEGSALRSWKTGWGGRAAADDQAKKGGARARDVDGLGFGGNLRLDSGHALGIGVDPLQARAFSNLNQSIHGQGIALHFGHALR